MEKRISSFHDIQPRYEEHPAYRAHVGLETSSEGLMPLMAEADAVMAEIPKRNPQSESEIENLVVQLLDPVLEKIRGWVAGSAISAPMQVFVRDALRVIRTQLKKDLIFKMRVQQNGPLENPYASAADTEQRTLEAQKDGITYFAPTSSSTLKKLIGHSLDKLDFLREKAKASPEGRTDFIADGNDPIWCALQEYFYERGVLTAATEYQNFPLKLTGASLEYSHPNQTWYKGCYQDVEVPTSKSVYMHYDYGFEAVKAMVYITPVSKKNGAFHFIRGSHQWPRSLFLTAFYRELDHALIRNVEPQRNQYYRRGFAVANLRKEFMTLPKIWRSSSHFGDDLLDDSDLSKTLLSQETPFEAPAGAVILFDGCRGIHRGSMVQEGERLAIQVILRQMSPGEDSRTLFWKGRNFVRRLRNKIVLLVRSYGAH